MNHRTTCLLIITFGLIFVILFSCAGDSDEPTSVVKDTPTPATDTPEIVPSPTLTSMPTQPSETPVPTPRWPPFTPSPEEPPECETDRQMIQAIVDAYHAETGVWPTSSYEVGKINWIRLIPDWMDEKPQTVLCTWTINEDPLGQVCRAQHC